MDQDDMLRVLSQKCRFEIKKDLPSPFLFQTR